MILHALIIFIAIEHLWFLVFEMFMWKTPYARKAFRMSPELAEGSAVLAANQGLYNGFLAAGLFWSVTADAQIAIPLQKFFVSCVAIAGIYGAFTASKNIFFVQGLPALIALVLLFF